MEEINEGKREIINKLITAKQQYTDALRILKESHCLESRIMYGALLKDFQSSIFHTNRQMDWLRYETDTHRGDVSE